MIFKKVAIVIYLPVFDNQGVAGHCHTALDVIGFQVDRVVDAVIESLRRNVKNNDIIAFDMGKTRKAILWKFNPFKIGRDICKPDFLMRQRNLQGVVVVRVP